MKKITIFLVLILFNGVLYSKNYKAIIKNIKKNLERKYRLELIYDKRVESTWSSVKYEVLNKSELKDLYKYLKLFENEFNKYPIDFVRKTNLKKILFVKKLSVSNQFRAACPDYFKEILYYDIYLGKHNKTYQKHVIHHEYYHMIEQEINGTAYFKDPKWKAINPNFQYFSGGGKSAYGSGRDVYKLSHPEKGFMNLYSMYGIEEDKAEIFAYLFTKKEYKKLIKFSKKDEVLNEKMRYMIDFLNGLSSKISSNYFKKIHKRVY